MLETQEPIQIRVSNENDDPAERVLLESRDQNTLLMLPLISRGETIGMMEVIDDRSDREFDAADVDFCHALCNVVAPAVQNAMLYAEMKELAARDKLTGLYNRRLFEEQFDAAVARSQRNGEQLSLLVVDLDGLKRINDLGGHPAGDEALRALADSLVESSRAGDIACRLGGDEFAVILHGRRPRTTRSRSQSGRRRRSSCRARTASPEASRAPRSTSARRTTCTARRTSPRTARRPPAAPARSWASSPAPRARRLGGWPSPR